LKSKVVVLGLDGFAKGWVAVKLDGNRRSIAFPRSIREILSIKFDRAAIDIPIGLNEDGIRVCDLQAREKLRPHGSRVFTGARRWLWEEFDDPDRANMEAIRRCQKRVSRQLWCLGRKINEVDEFVLTYHHLNVRETHPELVFLRLNDGIPLPSKHKKEGLALRKHLLFARGFAELDIWLDQTRRGKGAKRDDVLDACAAAIAARDMANSVPEGTPPQDSKKLPMQIWY
jgi:predicted RNase H-like nuclease